MQSSGSKTSRSKKSAEAAKIETPSTAMANEETPKPARKSPVKKTLAAKQHRGSAKKAPSSKAERNVIEPELPEVTVPTGRMTAESKVFSGAPEAPETVAIVETSPVQEPETASVQAAVSHGDIASLAYSYWVERGHQGGSPEEDWARAEQELSFAK